MAIPYLVNDCLDKFAMEGLPPALQLGLDDELGRFRIWTGNVAAHRSGRRSLEYRLRDSSDLKNVAQSLLKDLILALSQLKWTTLDEDRPDEDAGSDCGDYD
ncbi:hypothetical protein EJ03DRAFT_351074 [Teratosphaeria nubilosa]|uniref:Uncharacterized protein n=1 Tax=Teratosphaeria nubilosa TaxID=161662 RepID=A0A6G1L9L6_9PEZI|nr:hypothetical protein EJ03DRAFT_351074 [Teratosphaeria nubilosa]